MAQVDREFNMHAPSTYCICIQGELDQSWFEYFGAQSVSVGSDGSGSKLTSFISEPVDQGALVGLINRLNALGIVLISVSATRRPESGMSNDEDDQMDAGRV